MCNFQYRFLVCAIDRHIGTSFALYVGYNSQWGRFTNHLSHKSLNVAKIKTQKQQKGHTLQFVECVACAVASFR